MLQDTQNETVLRVGPDDMLLYLQDFFDSFETHTTSTGIQRVQMGIGMAALGDERIATHFIINGDSSAGTGAFVCIDPVMVRAIFAYIGGDVIEQRKLRVMLAEARQSAIPVRFTSGCTIVIAGVFWGAETGVERYLEAKQLGARLVALVYDIIPLSYPEYTDPAFSNAFWRALSKLLHVVDYIVTISNFTKREVERFMIKHGVSPVPIDAIALAHVMADDVAVDSTSPSITVPLGKQPYALYVSTIEARKNHMLLILVWQRLIADGVAVPDLVFLGRMGWRIEPLKALLSETRNLNGRVRIVEGLSDHSLDDAYRNALFTVFTSHVEGWGLPIGESLARGVPCIVSDRASMPEVGGRFNDYIDPDDFEGTVRVVRRMIEDDGYRAERRAEIARDFVPRSWGDVGWDFLRLVIEHRRNCPAPKIHRPVRFREGGLFRPGTVASSVGVVSGYPSAPMELATIDGFYNAESDGAWMRGSSGTLTFDAGEDPGEILVYLAIEPAGFAVGTLCTVRIPGDCRPVVPNISLRPGTNLFQVTLSPTDDGLCSFTIISTAEPRKHPGDPRSIALRLRAIGYSRRSNFQARSALREELLLE